MKYILKIDISGIQKFIFDIPSEKAAKELKARSFYVYSLTHIIFEMLKAKIGTDKVTEIYNGGGNLFVYVESNQEVLEEFRKEIEQQDFQGVLFPFVSFVEVKGNFKEDMQNLSREVLKVKLQRKFDLKEFEQTRRIEWADFIGSLIKSNGFVVEKRQASGGQIYLQDYVIAFDGNNFENNVLNKLPIDPEDPEGNITDFSSISKNVSDGADEKIAALKMDVDNLGLLFRNKEEQEYREISQKMERFFSKDLYQKVLKSRIEKQELYPVFAGGDDLFLIGSWDKIIEIAAEINEAFRVFQKELNLEKPLTLSGGIVLGNPKYPLIRLAEEVEKALDLAKNYREDKNSICLFGEPMGWEEMEQCEEIKSKLLDLVVNRGESRSLLQRIKSSDLGFRSVQDRMMDTNKIDLPKVYRLKYYLRNAKTEENRKILTEIFNAYAEDLLSDFLHKGTKSNPAKYVVAARLTELLTKNKSK